MVCIDTHPVEDRGFTDPVIHYWWKNAAIVIHAKSDHKRLAHWGCHPEPFDKLRINSAKDLACPRDFFGLRYQDDILRKPP